jgi:hypothetical protein
LLLGKKGRDSSISKKNCPFLSLPSDQTIVAHDLHPWQAEYLCDKYRLAKAARWFSADGSELSPGEMRCVQRKFRVAE